MLKILNTLLDWITPEDTRIAKMLSLGPTALNQILPRSNLIQRDILALFDYQNKMVRLLVRSMKFKNNPKVKRLLAEILYEAFTDMAMDIKLFQGALPTLIPVPMSKKERNKRGWNQSEELVKEMVLISKGRVEAELGLLSKVRDTKSQILLSREERLKNVLGSMQVFDSKNILKDRVVIVLDDIHTTGSTFSEARRALLLAGTKKVYGLFLAH
ncbi:MAG: hypothetical protein AAB392_00375 [Patescibacteria group bacterium]